MKNISLHNPRSAGGMLQNAQRKKVYHRGHLEGNKYIFSKISDEDADSGEEEHYSLHVYKPEPYVEKEVQPGDTLQTLSLQFNCPIAELKRMNNIHRDNEIFARRTIRVPARLFTMKLPGVHTSGSKTASEGSDTCTSSESLSDNVNNGVLASSHIPRVEVPVRKLEDIVSVPTIEFLTSEIAIDEDKGRTMLQDGIENVDIECSTSPLLPRENSILPEDRKSIYSCSGADWGLSWLQLLVCSLLLGFAAPILYVIYITEDSNKHHTDT
ncbi:lysM and putative peptidoglycan-binding domain-containing protein 3 [Periplaneta americana]|uniref:lysM and putative peptidoglycan-binding domain-containing protein 3 n=1 Tax=Periplaneta americana TaxID=6978 RepID=UPI0037E75C12